MTVEEMLARISSQELAEWRAYEKAFGPVGHQYSDRMLGQLHELGQINNRMIGMQYSTNPAPVPTPAPRPTDFFATPEEDEGVTIDEFNEQFE